MKTKYLNILKIFVFVVICFVSLGYAAFGAELSISNIVADVRVKSDIRITGIGITGGNISGGYDGLNWDTDSVMLGDLISGKGDFVNLEVTVTNFGNSEMGIYDIVVPEGIDFEISNYDMESKICNASGKCNLGISKTLNFKVSNNNYSDVSKSVKIDFEFREMHSITYEGITNNGYPISVIDGGYLSVNFRNDIPENVVVYNSGIKLDSSKYDYSDNDLTVNNVTGDLVIKSAKNLFNIIKLKTNGVDTNINFGVASSETNGDGVNTISGTENDQYPVYYYRGNVTDNKVLFADLCWRIVRTTDTGGVKLIYDGNYSPGYQCKSVNPSIGAIGYNDRTDTEMDVNYVFDQDSNGDGYLDSSNVKSAVDYRYKEWFVPNYIDMFEDTIWCNDKSIGSIVGSDIYYGATERLKASKPSLFCVNEEDRLTVSSGKIKYPTGMLTADEVAYSGIGSYLFLEDNSWYTMTPMAYESGYAFVYSVKPDNTLTYNFVGAGTHYRPSVSLKAGTLITSGDGTAASPYIVE